MNYDTAEEYFKNGDYLEAFSAFKILAEDLRESNLIRANAYTMMGVISSGFADIDEDEDSGLKYFKKALQLDSENLGTLINIVGTFGNEISMHLDREVFKSAYDLLLTKFKNNLTAEHLLLLEKKHDMYLKHGT